MTESATKADSQAARGRRKELLQNDLMGSTSKLESPLHGLTLLPLKSVRVLLKALMAAGLGS